MDIKSADVISFGSLVLAGVLAYMQTKNKTVIWLLVIVGLVALGASIFSRSKPKGEKIKQTASASGDSTINQVGGNQTINQGVSQSDIEKLLTEKAVSANEALNQKYSAGWTLMGISDGRVIFEPRERVFRFDPNNDVTIRIDEAAKTAEIMFVYFKITFVQIGDLDFQIDQCTMTTPYVPNTPQLLKYYRLALPDGSKILPYVEVLDGAKRVFVLGFKKQAAP